MVMFLHRCTMLKQVCCDSLSTRTCQEWDSSTALRRCVPNFLQLLSCNQAIYDMNYRSPAHNLPMTARSRTGIFHSHDTISCHGAGQVLHHASCTSGPQEIALLQDESEAAQGTSTPQQKRRRNGSRSRGGQWPEAWTRSKKVARTGHANGVDFYFVFSLFFSWAACV